MKKALTLFLALAMCLCLCACGQSQAAKDTDAAIGAIGEVGLSSGDAIAAAEALYNELTDEEKESLKNGDALSEARDTYDTMFSAELSRMIQAMTSITDAMTIGDVLQAQSLLEAFRAELASATPTIKKELDSLCVETGGMTAEETMNSVEVILAGMCINNTFLALPEYVLEYESMGAWLVNDHGDFAAYNWWCSNIGDLDNAYEAYKSYISQYTEITDLGDSFTFLDNDGNTLTVCTSGTSSNAVLQVRVPRF